MSAAESSTTATLGKRKSILDSPKVVEEGDQVVMYTGVEAMVRSSFFGALLLL
jgi:hypothetical protein